MGRTGDGREARRGIVTGGFVTTLLGFVVSIIAQLSNVVNSLGWLDVVIYLLLLIGTLPVSYVYTINNGEVSVQVLLQLLAAILVSYLGLRWVVALLVEAASRSAGRMGERTLARAGPPTRASASARSIAAAVC